MSISMCLSSTSCPYSIVAVSTTSANQSEDGVVCNFGTAFLVLISFCFSMSLAKKYSKMISYWGEIKPLLINSFILKENI